MRTFEGILMALQQIRANKLKSFFTLIGVIIGITFFIAVITVVEGMNRYVQDDFAGSIFGINTFTVVRRTQVTTGEESQARRRREARNPDLTLRDAEAVRAAVPGAWHFAYSTDAFISEGATYGEKRRRNIRVIGGSEEYEILQGWNVEQGRSLTSLDQRRGLKVAVVGAEIAERLFPDASPVGKRIRVGAHRFGIVGVWERQGGFIGNIRDASLLIPFSTYQQTYSSQRDKIEDIQVKMHTAEEMDPAILEVEAALRSRRGLRPGEENTFHVQTSSEILNLWETINRVLMAAIPGLVSISLLVGGIVIMNIMLLSVAGRTREIGIRKALGARRVDILLQFLAESSTLSVIGSIIGLGLGIGLGMIVEATTPLPASVPAWALGVGLALGVIIGVGSGLYPAYRAARQDPIVALGHE